MNSTGMLNQLRAELTAKIPKIDLEKAKTPGSPEERRLKKFLASDALMKQMLVADGAKGGKYGPRGEEEHKLNRT